MGTALTSDLILRKPLYLPILSGIAAKVWIGKASPLLLYSPAIRGF
jgi:hypothetical protein